MQSRAAIVNQYLPHSLLQVVILFEDIVSICPISITVHNPLEVVVIYMILWYGLFLTNYHLTFIQLLIIKVLHYGKEKDANMGFPSHNASNLLSFASYNSAF